MTEPNTERIHEILYSTDSREELARRIVGLEEENERLRGVLESYAKTFEGWAADNNGNGRHMDGPDWLELANELRMGRDGI